MEKEKNDKVNVLRYGWHCTWAAKCLVLGAN